MIALVIACVVLILLTIAYDRYFESEVRAQEERIKRQKVIKDLEPREDFDTWLTGVHRDVEDNFKGYTYLRQRISSEIEGS
ncbi:hypothetical protein SAMN02745225_00221 [Ferrithrix thermotolerans DSM 19514]|uniref:Uncharacterized protein n=2 Tax=Ferrithrix TaxID=643949 RepID=A0A1M4SD99_9ACTN|nr:hypothetical protein SAMN02745225_00221 [Ferrithrix thermotolerans DSM 19514]